MEKEPVTWSEVTPSVIRLAEELIKEFHPHLLDARIGFVFRSESQKSGDKEIIGHASKVSARDQVFLEYDFLIWISEGVWVVYDDTRRRALIDHELCHCWKDPFTGTWKMRRHDVEEFSCIVERYGWWKRDLREFRDAAVRFDQKPLPGIESVPQGKVDAVNPDDLTRHEDEVGKLIDGLDLDNLEPSE